MSAEMNHGIFFSKEGMFLYKAVMTDPAKAGISPESLGYIDGVMQRAIDEKVMKGMVTLVARKGKIVQLKAYGHADEGIPMREDAVFRLASMSKTVGAAALMQLFDRGLVMPSDPVSEYLPGFHKTRVASIDPTGCISLEEPEREITIHDLLTMRSGITPINRAYEIMDPVKIFCADRYREAGIIDTMHPLNETIGDVCDRLAGLPVASQPGSRWDYSNLSSIVLGRVVEIVSGQDLLSYLKDHIFDPLEMEETTFFPDSRLYDRIPAVFACGSMERLDGLDVPGTDDTQLARGPSKKYYNIAAGLHGTILDYYHFTEMLRCGGTFRGRRVLSRNAVDLMTRNHIGRERTYLYGHGWGYMVNVQEEVNTMFNYMGHGSYGWHGYWGSVFNIWPEKDMTAIMISQVSPVLPSWKPQERFLNVVAGSLV